MKEHEPSINNMTLHEGHMGNWEENWFGGNESETLATTNSSVHS